MRELRRRKHIEIEAHPCMREGRSVAERRRAPPRRLATGGWVKSQSLHAPIGLRSMLSGMGDSASRVPRRRLLLYGLAGVTGATAGVMGFSEYSEQNDARAS